jgi:NAD(P)-dependent dehydrogenase (short-subunit alcohol dehydrogenase family)
MSGKRVALVTGASSGIGREIAGVLAENGFEVFGSVRKPDAADSAKTFAEVRMDVTDTESVTQAVSSVLERAGGIDVLINNAGYGLMGALEETSVLEAQQLFDVNFFGALRVTGAVLPTMRRQKQGRIVNVSSLMGIVPAPFLGVYAASKHALECYTETLDHEVKNLGIRALLVEPGFTKTKFEVNGRYATLSLDAYESMRKRVAELMKGQFAKGAEAAAVAEVVLRAVKDPSPRLRYRLPGGDALSRLRRFAPERLFAWGVRRQLQLDR